MKLIKCYVYSFGKLKDFEYYFNQNLNTINQENGWGKSTFTAFIKAMFYGLNDKKRSVAENERVKYKPWNSTEKFGGYVVFDWQDKQFKIERFFGSKESDDTVVLTDTRTGKTFADTKDLGKRIFQIDEEGFLSTTCFTQKEFEVKSNSSITAKFNSVFEVQDPLAFDKACKKIEERAKEYKYRGGKGKIADLKEQIHLLDEKSATAQLSYVVLDKLNQENSQLLEKEKQLKEQYTTLSDKLVLASKSEAVDIKKKQLNELVAQRNDLKNQLQNNISRLNGHDIQPEQLVSIKQTIEDYRVNQITLNNLTEEVNAFLVKQTSQKNNNSKLIGLFAFGLLALIFGVLGAFVSPWCFVGCGVFVIATILTLLKKPSTFVNDSFNQKTEQINQLKQKIAEQKVLLDRFFESFVGFNQSEYSLAFENLYSLIKNSNQLVNEIKILDQKIKLLESDKDIEKQVDYNLGSVEQLKQEMSFISRQLDDLSYAILEKKNAILRHEEVLDEMVFVAEKRQDLVSQLNESIAEHDILSKTLEFLTKADENLKVKYKQPLQQSLDKYLTKTFGNQIAVDVDIDLNLKPYGEGLARDTDYFSKGNQNLFEICKRFALIDVLFVKEKPFIILDDPFANLDKDKLERSKQLVQELSKEYQILYLVCHESREI